MSPPPSAGPAEWGSFGHTPIMRADSPLSDLDRHGPVVGRGAGPDLASVELGRVSSASSWEDDASCTPEPALGRGKRKLRHGAEGRGGDPIAECNPSGSSKTNGLPAKVARCAAAKDRARAALDDMKRMVGCVPLAGSSRSLCR